MKKQYVEEIIKEYLRPIFGFALKRCSNAQDAEDLSQEIVLKAYRALIAKDDVVDVRKFIWTIAHNALSNYYRDSTKATIGVSIDEFAEKIADPNGEACSDDDQETIHRLQSEIAYLSKLQRKIVIAYYFENRKQADIARELGIPVGTVKWHLFEAKKELKRGMGTMRKSGELKFNPVKFRSFGINGSIGNKPTDDYFRSALSQNIAYCVRDTAKTVNEIAEELGVSPVYVESEIEFLEEYGFLQAQKGKFIANFMINEPTAELLVMRDRMYKRAAELIANDLYDELTSGGILDDPSIVCRQSDGPVSLGESKCSDRNFLLWSLIPFIVARSGEELMDDRISFDEVATIRPDGAHNIFHAYMETKDMVLPDDHVYMRNWSGPMWNGKEKLILWRVDSEWSDRGEGFGIMYRLDADKVLSLYMREKKEKLSSDEYAWLAERGYIKTNGDRGENFKAEWQIVILADNEIRNRLLEIGDRIKAKHWRELENIKDNYAKAEMETVPAHLRKIVEYEQQFMFHSDGWFLLHCIVLLLKNGRLKEPTKEQKKSLCTMIINAQ